MNFSPCIVVPVFNHGNDACALAERLKPFGLRAIFVNDGSRAQCTEALRQLSQQNDWIDVIEHEKNRGKGGAVLSGLRAALAQGFTHALQIDADNQHDTNDIPRFLSTASENPGAVITGQPLYDASAPVGRRMARYITHVWVWIETLSFTIRDSMCGFRVYPVEPALRLANRTKLGQRMDFDSDILVRLFWTGMPVLSLPTAVIYPPGGESNFRLFYDNILITRMHVRLVFGMLWRAPILIYRRALAQP